MPCVSPEAKERERAHKLARARLPESKKWLRSWVLKTRYGITQEAVDSLLTKQNHQCPICDRPLTSSNLAVDHCHETKIVRGILCRGCNGALGQFGDSREGLLKALAYLEEPL